MSDSNNSCCQACFLPLLPSISEEQGQLVQEAAQVQWVSFCRCNRPFVPKSQFSIDVCANCKRRVAALCKKKVTRQDLCTCENPNPQKIPSQLKPNEAEPVTLDLASVKMPPEYFPADRFTPLAFLGDSPRALVLLCRDKQRGARVVVKFFKGISSTLYSTFESELRKNKQLSHTNIARIIDSGIHNGKTPYVVTEYKEGFNLEQCVSLYGVPSYDVAVKILLGVCETLGYAMKQGVLHRDLRPGNMIFLDDTNSDPTICVTDFALAKVKASEEPKVPWYLLFMSGDEARGLEYSEKSELYCLASIGYFLLTGLPPFTDDSALELKNLHALKLPRRISSIKFSNERPSDLDEVIERCLEKDPKDRFESIAKFQERLEVFPRRVQMRIAEALAAQNRAKLIKIAAAVLVALAVCAAAILAFVHH